MTGLEAANAVMDTLHGQGQGMRWSGFDMLGWMDGISIKHSLTSTILHSINNPTGPNRARIIPVEADEPHVAVGRRLSKVARTLQRNLPFYDFPLR